jgi:uncharacterized protein
MRVNGWQKKIACLGVAVLSLGVSFCLPAGAPGDQENPGHEPVAGLLERAGNGDSVAQYNLGLLYEDGKLVPKNLTEAVRWFTKAAERDFSGAQFLLGKCYAEGHGVKRDMVRAYMWMTLAVLNADEEEGETIFQARAKLAKKMTPEQVAEASRLAEGWKPAPQ